MRPTPGGAGNRGGSFLAITKYCKDPRAAFALISWLESAKNQAEAFKDPVLFPSTPASYTDPRLTAPDPFFGGQQIVDVFADAAKKYPGAYFSPYDTIIRSPIAAELVNVEVAGKSSDQAWKHAQTQIHRELTRAGGSEMAVSDAIRSTSVLSSQEQAPDRPPSRYRRAPPQYAAVSPFFILFAIFGAFPVFFSIWLSFHSWDDIGAMKWVGLEQYSYLLSDPSFWKSITNTLIIWVISTVPMLLPALVIANALHNATRFRSFYRIAYFVANITSVVAVTMVFGSVFSNNFGLLNAFLQSIGGTRSTG